MTHPAHQKKASQGDWHPADVMAALHKVGWSLRQLALEHGYTSNNVLSIAMRRPYPKCERIIADALGVKPERIWPSRYTSDGRPNRPQGPGPMRPKHLGKPMRPATAQVTTPASGRNTQTRKAA